MKELPEVNTSFGDLYRTLYEPIRTKLLLTGIEPGIFDHLSEPRDITPGMVSTTLMGLDMGLNQGFIAESMLRCGFQSVCSQTIDVIVGPWELDIGQKAQIKEDR